MPTFPGTSGNDAITGTAGDDIINGEAGNDTLVGGEGSDSLYGGDGTDTLEGGAGADLLDGGAGSDTARYSAASAGVTVSLMLAGQQNTVGAGLDTLVAIESLFGSGFNDTLTGNDLANGLSGGVGDDVLTGLGGSDSLSGGSGNDILDGGDGFDTARYSEGPTHVDLAVTGPQITGVGSDTLIGIENLQGGTFNDMFAGNGERNTLIGVSGDDTLVGRGGDDLLQGGTGQDYLDGGDGIDTATYADIQQTVVVDLRLQGEQQNTVSGGYDLLTGIENLTGTNFGDLLTGDGGANTLIGSGGFDSLDGQGGDDVLLGGAGDDVLTGGLGADMASYRDALAGVTVSLALQGGSQNTVAMGLDTLNGMEGLAGSGFNDTLTGDAAANWLQGNGGADQINGGEGLDRAIFSGNRADYDIFLIDGVLTVVDKRGGALDEGTDTLVSIEEVQFADGLVAVEDLNLGPPEPVADTLLVMRGQTVSLDAAVLLANDHGGSTVTSVSNVVGATVSLVDGRLFILAAGPTASFDYTVAGGDFTGTGHAAIQTVVSTTGADVLSAAAFDAAVLNGLAGNDTLTGSANDDTLIGGTGNDVLSGGAGADRMEGGAGTDTFYVDSLDDVVVEVAGGGRDTVYSSIDLTLADEVDILRLTGAALIGIGNGLANTLVGTNGANVLDGAAGADRMEGGLGADTYYVDDLGDRVVETGVGIDTVISSVDFTLGSNVENLTLAGATGRSGTGNALVNLLVGTGANDRLDGAAGDDTLNGGEGDDILLGGAGSDILDGGAGADAMTGGAGHDVYHVRDAGDVVVEAANGGTDSVSLWTAAYTLGANVENLTVLGGLFATVHGNVLANVMTAGNNGVVFWGEAGNDTLIGGTGADQLFGGDGADILEGRGGADQLFGGAGADTYRVTGNTMITEAVGGGIDTIILTARDAQDFTMEGMGEVENLIFVSDFPYGRFVGSGNEYNNVIRMGGGVDWDGGDIVHGLGGNDIIYGAKGNDVLYGDEGNDILYGQENRNELHGGIGNDTFYATVGDDVRENLDEGIDTLMLTRAQENWDMMANVENLTYVGDYSELVGSGVFTIFANVLNNTLRGGAQRDRFAGREGNDIIYGAGGNDDLSGNEGNDVLIGGAGADLFTGDAGADRFDYASVTDSSAANGMDWILDFDSQDIINLRAIDANTGQAGDQLFAFIGTAAFTSVAGQLRYTQIDGDTYLQGDVNGDGLSDLEIHFLGAITFNTGDFWL